MGVTMDVVTDMAHIVLPAMVVGSTTSLDLVIIGFLQKLSPIKQEWDIEYA